MFQSPRSGKFVSNGRMTIITSEPKPVLFQSPRSGKFVSDGKNKVFGYGRLERFVSIP